MRSYKDCATLGDYLISGRGIEVRFSALTGDSFMETPGGGLRAGDGEGNEVWVVQEAEWGSAWTQSTRLRMQEACKYSRQRYRVIAIALMNMSGLADQVQAAAQNRGFGHRIWRRTLKFVT